MENVRDESLVQLDIFQEQHMFFLRAAIEGYTMRGIEFEQSLDVFMHDILWMIDCLQLWLRVMRIEAIPEVVQLRNVPIPAGFAAKLAYASNVVEVLSLHVGDVMRLAPRVLLLTLYHAGVLLALALDMNRVAELIDQEQRDFEEEERGGEDGESSSEED